MATQGLTPYDTVAYASHSHAQSQPDRLATIATLCGMTPAPPQRCRVLELGCGDGTNVLSMAVQAPESRFVGIDLASTAIAAGNAQIRELGLTNVELHAASIAELPPGLGEFDYVTSHGVYSWIPQPVRDALMAAARAHLAPHGVAYVSYMVYPGAYAPRSLREMMRFHVRAIADDGERVRQAVAFLRLLDGAGARKESDPWRAVVAAEVARITSHDTGQLRHDELADVNEPVWWYQFADHAHRHGLQFLGEADWFESSDALLAADARKVIASLRHDRVIREQYLDFCKCRRFRQTLLVRAGTPLDVEPAPALVRRFFLSSPVKLPELREPLGTRAAERFEGPAGGAIETDAPLVRAAMREFVTHWPRRLTFDELVTLARARIESEAPGSPAPGDDEVKFLEHVLLRLFESGLVRLALTRPPIAAAAPERPVAPRLARLQARDRTVVTSLLCDNVMLEDDTARRLLRLLDGTRDRASLLADLRVEIAALPAERRPAQPPSEPELEAALTNLAGLALIEERRD